jgi:hypothetical protein
VHAERVYSSPSSRPPPGRHAACSVLDPATGYFGTCTTPDDGTFVPAVTVYRQ